jgi:hypothetical protein
VNSRLIVINVLYYLVIFIFFFQGRSQPSSSLGYGFFVLGFWIISGVALIILIAKNWIPTNGIWNKVGVFLATPCVCLLMIGIMVLVADQVGSESHFSKNGYRYRVVRYQYGSSETVKRIEIYRSEGRLPIESTSTFVARWLRDSTWTYYSKAGDTIRVEKYSNDKKIDQAQTKGVLKHDHIR